MKHRFCFWSIARGKAPRDQARRMVESARAVGLFRDFHIWSDHPIDGAVTHPLSKVPGWRGGLLPLRLTQHALRRLQYDYFVWLDPDTFFARMPNDLLQVLQGSPVHSSLEYDAAVPSTLHPDWGPCSLANFVKLMTFNGVRQRSVFTVNSGFWIVHHDALETFHNLAGAFWWFCKAAGYRLEFAPLLAYVTQILCGNPYPHELRRTSELWAPVRTRSTHGRLPPGGAWNYVNYFSGKVFKVKPALVHPLRIEQGVPG